MKHRGKAYSFSQLNVGMHEEFTVKIDEAMHANFARLSGDCSPIHCNDEYARKSRFGQRIGYAFLLTSFLSRLYGEYLPGGSSICIKQEAKFLKPFFIGDEIRIVGTVVSKTESARFVEIETQMYREEDCVLKAKGIVQVSDE